VRLFTYWLLAAAFLVPFATKVAAATPVSLTAVDRPGGLPMQGTVSWTIIKINKASGLPEADPVATGMEPTLVTDLPPGHYIVNAASGALSTKQAIFVGYSTTQRNIALNTPGAPGSAQQPVGSTPAVATPAPAEQQASTPAAAAPAAQPAAAAPVSAVAGPPARLSINMIASSGNKPIKEAIGWEIFTYQKGATENGVKVADMAASTGVFSLPAGSYVVRAHYRETNADLVIPMAPGQHYTYTINLYAGYAKPYAVKQKEITRGGVTWQIVKQIPNAQGQYILVAESNDPLPQLMVREGKYLAIARQGDMWGMEPLKIDAGQTNKLKVTLKKAVGAPVIAAAN
jgi:hypothetical protein